MQKGSKAKKLRISPAKSSGFIENKECSAFNDEVALHNGILYNWVSSSWTSEKLPHVNIVKFGPISGPL